VLAANTAYYLSSQETRGADAWFDLNTTLTTTNVAACNNAEFYSGTAWTIEGASGNSYVPVNFVYEMPAPTNLAAFGGDEQVSLSWTATLGATSYNIYRGTTAGGESSTPIGSCATASYTDTGLTDGGRGRGRERLFQRGKRDGAGCAALGAHEPGRHARGIARVLGVERLHGSRQL
jgi:hypothetical protein